jgi:hypothetical protein
MKLWVALRDASRGWAEIVLGRQGWRERFSFSAAGLATALIIYFFFAFLSIAFGAIGTGMPGAAGVVTNLLVQGLYVVALVIAVYASRKVLDAEAPAIEFITPGIYALVFYLIAGTIVAAVGIELIALVLIGLGFLLYRLGRMAGGWPMGVSAAFGIFTVVLLVGLPLTLYMLSNPAGSPS